MPSASFSSREVASNMKRMGQYWLCHDQATQFRIHGNCYMTEMLLKHYWTQQNQNQNKPQNLV